MIMKITLILSKVVLSLLVIFLITPAFSASISDINQNKLPSTAEISGCISEVERLEPFVKYWTPKWEYDIPKKRVVSTIKDCYKKIDILTVSYPDNCDLLLLQGLIAHYAYNLDLTEFFGYAKKAYEKASELDPSDIRPRWFMGVLLVQSRLIIRGMETILEIARKQPYNTYPASFWEDYAYCSYLAGMPANALMGADRAEKISGRLFEQFFLIRILEHMKKPSTEISYEAKDIWRAKKDDKNMIFINRMFGYSIACPGDWKVNPAGVGQRKGKASNMIVFKPPAYQGFKESLGASIFVVAEVNNKGEKLDKFAKSFSYYGPLKEIKINCPYAPCKAYEMANKDMYAHEGGGRFLIVVFSREEPMYPGIVLETPEELDIKSGVLTILDLRDFYTRWKGPINYLVGLDAAESIYSSAKKDFEFIVTHITAE
jgi:tetratricopeptide (TPR) repeat protein